MCTTQFINKQTNFLVTSLINSSWHFLLLLRFLFCFENVGGVLAGSTDASEGSAGTEPGGVEEHRESSSSVARECYYTTTTTTTNESILSH